MIKGRLESHGCSLAPCPWRPTSAQSAAENRSRSRVPNDGHEMEASTIGTACLFTSFYIVIFFPTFRKFLEGKFVANRIMAGIWIVGPRSRWKGWNEGEVSWKKWGAGLVIEMFRRGVRSRVNA